MKPKAKSIVAGLSTLLGFASLAVVVHRLAGLTGRSVWILYGGFWFLGLIAAVLVFLYFRSRKAAPAPAAGGDEIGQALGAAERRLIKAPGVRARIGNSPLFLVIGGKGSAKTSIVLNSGLQPELLAGEVHRGGALLPTTGLNVWFANRAVIVEASGQVIQDQAGWNRLLGGVQASRWRAAFTPAKLASRGVVVCVSCDDLLQAGARESVTALAKELRGRLLEAADVLGVRLPVYVVFTKTDRLEGFEDYVRHLSGNEVDSVLGATLPVAPVDTEAVHSERESRRLETAFRDIADRLSMRRVDILPRDQAPEGRLGAYLFPRTFAKASEPAIQFLVELCKPSHLRVSPVLRGFYFTGCRQVVADGRPADPKPAFGTGRQGSSDATVAFSAAAGPAPWRSSASASQVPQWVFLRQIFDRLLLKDQAAIGATGRGRRVDLVRRAALATAAVFGLVTVVGLAFSFRNNRRLAETTTRAMQAVEAVPASGQALPSLRELQALDGLRAQVESLSTFERGRTPLSYRWGLNLGSRLHTDTRSVYFRHFRRLLWDRTRGRLVDYLRLLPAENPTPAGYTMAYEGLKAYFVTTSFPDSAAANFLTPVLEHHWADDAGLDPSVVELATRQFAFYADELPFGNPYQDLAADVIIDPARGFLNTFKGADPLYPRVIARARQAGQSISFSAIYPGAAGVVANAQDVSAEFSRKGWNAAHLELQDVEALFNREQWVLGPYTVEAADRALLAAELRTRYEADYIRAWLAYVRAGSVVRFNNPATAGVQLERLGDLQAPPLLQMLALASVETNIDSSEVGTTFQPVRAVVPPDSARYVFDQNSSYVNGLLELASAMRGLEAATGGAAQETAKSKASEVAQTLRNSVASIEKGFQSAGPNALGLARTVRALLLQPAEYTETLLGQVAGNTLNEKGVSFCAPFRAIAAKYPFNPGGPDATPAEITDLLVPEQGVLWTFVDNELSGVVQRRATGFGAAPGADPRPNPAFLQFLNTMARISNSWYSPGSGPRMEFTLRPGTTAEVPTVNVSIGGRAVAFERNNQPSGQFVWEPARKGARLTAIIRGQEVVVAAEEGTWAVFRLLRKAVWTDLGDGAFSLRWQIPNSSQQVEAKYQPVVSATASVQLGARDLRIDCVSQVVSQ